MNKPAAKEPSMDEILSSIRQIISDDDAAAAPDTASADEPASDADPAGGADMDDLPSFDAFLAEESDETPAEPEPEPEPEPVIEEPLVPDLSELVGEGDDALALSLDQVIADEAGDADDDVTVDDDYSLPDDVAFVASDTPEPPSDVPVMEPPRLGTMPDPTLSDDLAEHLLDSTAQAAASSAFSRLGAMSLGGHDQTVEGVVRELLRPMLKSWLDENLPSIVERLVEREIERVSRGGGR